MPGTMEEYNTSRILLQGDGNLTRVGTLQKVKGAPTTGYMQLLKSHLHLKTCHPEVESHQL